MRRLTIMTTLIAMASLCLFSTPGSKAQKLPKSFEIQAQAMGQSTQMGQNFGITVFIEEYSTPDEQSALLEAFTQKGNEGLVNALSKMKSKGRMSITGTLGYEVAYIREWSEPDGSTKLRLVTNRPITFGEAWSDSRSMDYSLSAIEIILSADKKHNEGAVLNGIVSHVDMLPTAGSQCMAGYPRLIKWSPGIPTHTCSSLCNLCVSVVVFSKQSSTTETQRTQRLHRESRLRK